MDVLTTIFSDFGVTWGKFLSQVILFAVVYLVLSKFAFGPVLAMLEERRKRIEEGQRNAEKIKKQLAEVELRYQEILRKANEDAGKLIEDARASADASGQKHLQQAIKDAGEVLVRAKEDITMERNKMVAEVKQEMVSLVIQTASKVTGKVLTAEDQQRLSAETAKELAA